MAPRRSTRLAELENPPPKPVEVRQPSVVERKKRKNPPEDEMQKKKVKVVNQTVKVPVEPSASNDCFSSLPHEIFNILIDKVCIAQKRVH